MTKAAVLALLLAACSKPTPEKACKHMLDLATKEIDRQLDSMQMAGGDMSTRMQGQLVAMKKERQSSRDADVDKCVKAIELRDVDPSCLADADRLHEATACFGKLGATTGD